MGNEPTLDSNMDTIGNKPPRITRLLVTCMFNDPKLVPNICFLSMYSHVKPFLKEAQHTKRRRFQKPSMVVV